MNKYCTVLVNSCDKYEEAWDPFFSLLKIYWPNCNFDIVLNTETKQYSRNDMDIKCINSPAEIKSWGARTKYVLEQIKTPYVIMLLEDFFLQDYVKSNEIEQCINRMNTNINIAAFYFKKIGGFHKLSKEYPEYIEMDENRQYKYNCQAGIWRRESLIDSLGDCETPWEYEFIGFEKSPLNNMKFYCHNLSKYSYLSQADVFSYLLARDTGYGIWQGKWLWNNKKLFEKNNINYTMKSLPKLRKGKFYFQKYRGKVIAKIKYILN